MSSRYIQVISLFLGSHSAILQYFKGTKARSTRLLERCLVAIPKTVMKGEAEDVIRTAYSSRYPDLALDQLLCLLVDGSEGQHFTIVLRDGTECVRGASLRLTDNIRKRRQTASKRLGRRI